MMGRPKATSNRMPRFAPVAHNLARRADRHLGAAASRATTGPHRRRLERISRLGALDPPAGGWAAGEPQPRQGGSLEFLIDGAEALPRMVAELERAESHVHIAGWSFSPGFALTRGAKPTILRDLLAELAERVEVRVLVWAGSPLPLNRLSRATVRRMRESVRRERANRGPGCRRRRRALPDALAGGERGRNRRPRRGRPCRGRRAADRANG